MPLDINSIYQQAAAFKDQPSFIGLDDVQSEKKIDDKSEASSLDSRKIIQLDSSAGEKAQAARDAILKAASEQYNVPIDSLRAQLEIGQDDQAGVGITALQTRKLIDYARAFSSSTAEALKNSMHPPFPAAVQDFLFDTIRNYCGNDKLCEMLNQGMSRNPPSFKLSEIAKLAAIVATVKTDGMSFEQRLCIAFLQGFGGEEVKDEEKLKDAQLTKQLSLEEIQQKNLAAEKEKGAQCRQENLIGSFIKGTGDFEAKKEETCHLARLFVGGDEEQSASESNPLEAKFADSVRRQLKAKLKDETDPVKQQTLLENIESGDISAIRHNAIREVIKAQVEAELASANEEKSEASTQEDVKYRKLACNMVLDEIPSLKLEEDEWDISPESFQAKLKALIDDARKKVETAFTEKLDLECDAPEKANEKHGPEKAGDIQRNVVWSQGKGKCYMMSLLNGLAATEKGRAYLQSRFDEEGKLKLCTYDEKTQNYSDPKSVPLNPADSGNKDYSAIERTLFDAYQLDPESKVGGKDAKIDDHGEANVIAKVLGLNITGLGMTVADTDRLELAFVQLKNALLERDKVCIMYTADKSGRHYTSVINARYDADAKEIMLTLRDSGKSENPQHEISAKKLLEKGELNFAVYEIPKVDIEPEKIVPESEVKSEDKSEPKISEDKSVESKKTEIDKSQPTIDQSKSKGTQIDAQTVKHPESKTDDQTVKKTVKQTFTQTFTQLKTKFLRRNHIVKGLSDETTPKTMIELATFSDIDIEKQKKLQQQQAEFDSIDPSLLV